MKKGLCILLSALMIALSFAACGKNDDIDNLPTKIDAQGNVYVEKTDTDGNEVTSVLSDKEAEKISKKAEKENKKTTTASQEQLSNVASKIENEMSGLTNFDENDLVSDKKDLISEGTEIKKTTLRDDVINKTMNSNKITLKMNLKTASGESTPVTLVSNGKKVAADMTMNGSSIRMIIDDDGAAVVLPTLKMYVRLSEDDFGGLGLDEFKDVAGEDTDTFVKSSKVTENGVEYTCEEYTSGDGTSKKYYFTSDNQWKRMEVIMEDEVAIYEIETFSSKVDESIFSLKGYTDMSALLNQAS